MTVDGTALGSLVLWLEGAAAVVEGPIVGLWGGLYGFTSRRPPPPYLPGGLLDRLRLDRGGGLR